MLAAVASGISKPLFANIFWEMIDSFGPGKTLADFLGFWLQLPYKLFNINEYMDNMWGKTNHPI